MALKQESIQLEQQYNLVMELAKKKRGEQVEAGEVMASTDVGQSGERFILGVHVIYLPLK